MVMIYLALRLNLLHLAVFTFTWQKVQHAAAVMFVLLVKKQENISKVSLEMGCVRPGEPWNGSTVTGVGSLDQTYP